MASRLSNLKNVSRQIYAIVEKEVSLKITFKFAFIREILTPLLSVFIPIFVMGSVFDLISNFGYWSGTNFIVMLFLGYQINLIQAIIYKIPNTFQSEKSPSLKGLLPIRLHRILPSSG